MTTTVPFDRFEQLLRLTVDLGGESRRFLLDTGVGITVVSSSVPAEPTGETVTARRMSGQEIISPCVRLPKLTVGSWSADDHLAAVADLGEVDGPNGFAGILGLDLFADQIVTIDPDAMTLTIQPPETFTATGSEARVQVHRDKTSIELFTTLVLPSGREVTVVVDTGSSALILDTRFMPDCGVEIGGPGMQTTTGIDETGYHWTRHRAEIPGAVHLADAPETAQPAPRVQFQEIIHDGLIGTAYLERYRLSIDVSGARLILGPRA
jgi:hypothetical protein